MPASVTLEEPLARRECDAWIARPELELPAEAPRSIRAVTVAPSSVAVGAPVVEAIRPWWKFW